MCFYNSRNTDIYSKLVSNIGTDAGVASDEYDVADAISTQLTTQKESISGVSLDEEAANLIKYQTAYQAAARVVSGVDSLLADAVNLGLDAAVQ